MLYIDGLKYCQYQFKRKGKMRKIVNFALISIVTFTLSFGANAALIDRGNGLVYDDVLDVTWLKDANYAQTSGFDSDGLMTWDSAIAWAAGLNFGGFDDWRLPTITVTDTNNNGTSDCDYSITGGTDCGFNVITDNSELAHMFYVNLGNVAYYDTSGNGNQAGYDILNAMFTDGETNQQVSFDNLLRSAYWSDTEYVPDTARAWRLSTQTGNQSDGLKSGSFYAWALRDGDVVSASAPASLTLMGLGLCGALGLRRKKQRLQ